MKMKKPLGWSDAIEIYRSQSDEVRKAIADYYYTNTDRGAFDTGVLQEGIRLALGAPEPYHGMADGVAEYEEAMAAQELLDVKK